MKTETDVFYLSRHPIPLTPEDVTLLLGKVKAGHNDIVSKTILLSLIEHRLSHRYIRPLSHVPVEPIDYKSGFLMMAAACLLIETLYSFRVCLAGCDHFDHLVEYRPTGFFSRPALFEHLHHLQRMRFCDASEFPIWTSCGQSSKPS